MTKIGGPRFRQPTPALHKGAQTQSASQSAATQKSKKSQASQAVQDVHATQAAQAAELQKIEEFIEAVQADEQSPSSPPDFNHMSQAGQYEYLQRLVAAYAAGDETAWTQQPGQVNLIGLRNFASGRVFTTKHNIYVDTLYVARLHDDKKQVLAFSANLQASLHDMAQNLGCGFYADDGKFVALPLLATGFYRQVFARAAAADDEIILQQKGLLALGPALQGTEEDSATDPDNIPSGAGQKKPMIISARWRGRFLRGRSGHADDLVEPACQLIHPKDWKKFQKLLAGIPAEQDQGMGGLSYLLLDGRELPSPEQEPQALSKKHINPRLVFQKSPDLQSQGFAGQALPSATLQSVPAHKKKTAADASPQLALLGQYFEDGL